MRKIIFTLVLSLLPYAIFAENAVLQKMEIAPLNRAKFFFNAKPDSYSTKISSDKLKIELKIKNAKIDKINSIQGAGAIESIVAKNNYSDLDVDIILKEKRGYTALYLPYSKALFVETFDWSKLNADEDAYRSGILALEDNLTESAREYLNKAKASNFPNSFALLSLIDLKEEKLTDSYFNAVNALKYKSDLKEVYAVLFYIHNFRKDYKKAQAYLKEFLKDNSIQLDSIAFNYAQALNLPAIINEDSLIATFAGSGDSANVKIFVDTTKQVIAIDSSQNQSDKSIFSNIPNWIYYAVVGVLFFAVFSLLILYKAYLKWREENLARRKKYAEKKSKEDNNFKEQTQPLFDFEEANAKTNENDFKPYTTKIIEKNKENKSKNEKKNNFSEKLGILLDNYNESKSKEYESIIEDADEEEFEESVPKDAKLEFAKRLQEQKTRSKFNKIGAIEDTDSNSEELSEKAKKMRIELGSIETKQSLNTLGNSEEKLNELRKKMGGNKNA